MPATTAVEKTTTQEKKKRVPSIDRLLAMRAEAEKSLDVIKAKNKSALDEARKRKGEIDRLIKIKSLAEARKNRKERTHHFCRVTGMLVKLVQDGDQDLYQYLIKKIEPHDQELACIWSDLPYEGKEPKGLSEAMEAMKKDPSKLKSYGSAKEMIEDILAEDDE